MVSLYGGFYECTSEGKWTTEPLVECVSSTTITCGSPPHIPNSCRTYTSTTKGSIASYNCRVGFNGQPFEAECGADGFWKLQGSYGCTPDSCEKPPTVDNTVTTRISGTTYGNVAAYECLPSYVHTGSSLKTCEANAKWSTNVVECVPRAVTFCGDPPLRDNTVFSYNSRMTGASAYYSFVEGYTGANATSDCHANGA
ncbi:sushi, von Willebrand factor type a, egf and pentraxin domain-containing protein 1 [Plakobranchus ocellatus]|uniref:Sushi, von Willebrand factor type a, egf and pentraxin domain-containing protein 1 n=1 Tax=Plakobranchus ocellatus TaxID=259542 RepID=A0AAV4C869_9GAST|nr:sushi, von Willebrand factor type a, egf and pentraxin domain-containing protein 1 [Plakobranchus ocellatus]